MTITELPLQSQSNVDMCEGYVVSRPLTNMLLTPQLPVKAWLSAGELKFAITKHLRDHGITRHLREKSKRRFDLKRTQLWRFTPPGSRHVLFNEIVPLLIAECHVAKAGVAVTLPAFRVNEDEATATVLKAVKQREDVMRRQVARSSSPPPSLVPAEARRTSDDRGNAAKVAETDILALEELHLVLQQLLDVAELLDQHREQRRDIARRSYRWRKPFAHGCDHDDEEDDGCGADFLFSRDPDMDLLVWPERITRMMLATVCDGYEGDGNGNGGTNTEESATVGDSDGDGAGVHRPHQRKLLETLSAPCLVSRIRCGCEASVDRQPTEVPSPSPSSMTTTGQPSTASPVARLPRSPSPMAMDVSDGGGDDSAPCSGLPSTELAPDERSQRSNGGDDSGRAEPDDSQEERSAADSVHVEPADSRQGHDADEPAAGLPSSDLDGSEKLDLIVRQEVPLAVGFPFHLQQRMVALMAQVRSARQRLDDIAWLASTPSSPTASDGRSEGSAECSAHRSVVERTQATIVELHGIVEGNLLALMRRHLEPPLLAVEEVSVARQRLGYEGDGERRPSSRDDTVSLAERCVLGDSRFDPMPLCPEARECAGLFASVEAAVLENRNLRWSLQAGGSSSGGGGGDSATSRLADGTATDDDDGEDTCSDTSMLEEEVEEEGQDDAATPPQAVHRAVLRRQEQDDAERHVEVPSTSTDDEDDARKADDNAGPATAAADSLIMAGNEGSPPLSSADLAIQRHFLRLLGIMQEEDEASASTTTTTTTTTTNTTTTTSGASKAAKDNTDVLTARASSSSSSSSSRRPPATSPSGDSSVTRTALVSSSATISAPSPPTAMDETDDGATTLGGGDRTHTSDDRIDDAGHTPECLHPLGRISSPPRPDTEEEEREEPASLSQLAAAVSSATDERPYHEYDIESYSSACYSASEGDGDVEADVVEAMVDVVMDDDDDDDDGDDDGMGAGRWMCSECTLTNHPRRLRCPACYTERPGYDPVRDHAVRHQHAAVAGERPLTADDDSSTTGRASKRVRYAYPSPPRRPYADETCGDRFPSSPRSRHLVAGKAGAVDAVVAAICASDESSSTPELPTESCGDVAVGSHDPSQSLDSGCGSQSLDTELSCTPLAPEPPLPTQQQATEAAGGQQQRTASHAPSAPAGSPTSTARTAWNKRKRRHSDADNDTGVSTSNSGGGGGGGGDAKDCILCCSAASTGCIIHGRIGHCVTCYRCAKKLWCNAKPCPVCRRVIDCVVELHL